MSSFLFLRPWWLLALPLLPLLLHLLRRHARAPDSPWRRVVDAALLPALLVQGDEKDGNRRRLWLWAGGWLLAILALAGPSWQRLPPLQFQPAAGPLSLLVSLSPELEETEVERLQGTLAELLGRMPPRPLSLWVSGSHAWRVMPASEDFRLLQRLVSVLEPALLPRGGSDLAQALRELARRQRQGEILVVTHKAEPAAVDAAKELARRGFRLLVLDPGGGDPQLQRLAEAGKGSYFPSSRIDALTRALRPRQFRQPSNGGAEVPVDNGPWLLPPLLVIVFLLFRRGAPVLGLVLLALLPPRAHADWRDLFFNPNQQALRALRSGHPELAARRFQDPLWRGIALYRAGRYQEAAENFAQLDSALAHYNRGNALVRLGDLEGAREAYRQALARDPDLVDARYNLDLVRQALAEEDTTPGRQHQHPPRGKGRGGVSGKPRKPPRENGAAEPAPSPRARPGDTAGPSGGHREKQGKGVTGPAPTPGSSGSREKPGAAKTLPGSEPRAADEKPREPSQPRDRNDQVNANRRRSAPSPEGKEVGSQAGPQATGKSEEAGRRRRSAPTGDEQPPRQASGIRPGPIDEVWLEAIEDDPAALLRALFRQQAEKVGP